MSNSKMITRVAPLASSVIISVFFVCFLVWRSTFDGVLGSLKLHIGSSRSLLMAAEEEERDDSMEFRMKRLITGKNLARFRATGFTCQTNQGTEQCITTNQVRMQNNPDGGITTYILPSSTHSRRIKPAYTLGDNETEDVSALPNCQFIHTVPAVVFSSDGLAGNMYQELDKLLVPLFLTTRHFKSDIQFVITESRVPSVIRKYRQFITGLSKFEPIYHSSEVGSSSSSTTHCFPGAVIGLNYHGNVAAINSSNSPQFGYTVVDFRRFMYQSFNLNNPYDMDTTKPTSKPVLVLISRSKSGVLLNENQLVKLMEEVGFQVHIATESETSDVEYFARVLSACDVLVGVHGDGLSNAVFMPEGGVVVQLVGLGLRSSGRYYYGDPAIRMGLRQVEYLIEPEESSLYDPEITVDPDQFRYRVVRDVYIDEQNVTVNLIRFKETLVQVWRSIS